MSGQNNFFHRYCPILPSVLGIIRQSILSGNAAAPSSPTTPVVSHWSKSTSLSSNFSLTIENCLYIQTPYYVPVRSQNILHTAKATVTPTLCSHRAHSDMQKPCSLSQVERSVASRLGLRLKNHLDESRSE